MEEEIARFGDILKCGDHSSRSGPVRSFPIRQSVPGISHGGAAYYLTPLVDVGRVTVAGENWPVVNERKAGTITRQ